AQAPPAEPPARPAADLAPGMSREQVVAAMGAPQREVTLQGKTWLTYPGLIVVLEGGKLVSANQTGQNSANAKLAVQSDPAGGDIYIDGQMVGQTPSTFDMAAGEHQVNVQLAGYQDWVRRVHVLAGSAINLNAKLEKK
ncbi:MAG: PEGA domain-containing protein, partial [Candidatus Acidiferrales bacterium]